MNEYEEIDNPEDKEEARDLALLASNIVAWAGPNAVPFSQALITASGYLDQAASFIAEEAAMGIAPVLTGVNPNNLPVPGPDYAVAFHGTGFTETTVVNWNGGDEITEFVNEGKVTTLVKPSTVEAALPFTLPVYVRNGDLKSNVLDFTFIEASTRREHGNK